MKRNIVETIFGAIVLILAGVFLAFSYRAADVESKTGYQVSARFSELGSLNNGSDVRISGVKVGTVGKIELDPELYLAKVTLNLDPDLQLPTDTAALISSEGLLGGSFLALEPGASEDMIAQGGMISYTQDAQNLERLLGQFIFSMQGSGNQSQSQTP
tara:strand:- start:103 stop:576 length:474 start_codon:yes stop_codon:yes gene_type:complete